MATEQPATDVPADAPVAAPEPAPAAPAEPAPSEPAPNESHPDEGKVVAPEIEAAAVPDVTPAAAEVVPVAQEGSRLVLHHLNNSRSQRILWLLEELGVPYEIKSYHRLPSMQAPPELKAIHPLGKSPVMQDGDVKLAESGAIIEYLIKKYGKGRFDPGEDGWVDNLYYTHYAEGSLQPIIVMSLIFSILPPRAPFFIRPIARLICNNVQHLLIEPQLKENAEMIEAHLSKSSTGWFASAPNPTSADFLMIFTLETLVSRGPGVGPKIKEYVARVHEREAWKRGIERGGKYTVA